MNTSSCLGIFLWLLIGTGAADAERLPPSLSYPQLFEDVQLHRVFPDSKTFADAVPRHAPERIEQDYLRQRGDKDFSLQGFVARNFELPERQAQEGKDQAQATQDELPVARHIQVLWPTLTRPAIPPEQATGSLLPLPARYVVPGGRFRELYYWDSYFTMLGLITQGRRDLAEDMVTNFAYLIDQHGHVPNGNRSYYLSRSQPPFFHLMVGLLATPGPGGTGPSQDDLAKGYARFLTELRREHAYWMDGAEHLAPGQAWRHAVALPDGAILNRFWDDRDTPRDESYREDVETAARSSRPAAQVYRDLRAGAESGWDYSSRWLANGRDLYTIHTTDLIPVDLNSLLYGLEQAVSEGCRWVKDLACMRQYRTLALRRRAAIERYLWDEEQGFFTDFDWRLGRRQAQLTAATVVPVFMDMAKADATCRVARVIHGKLLRTHGLLTTPDQSGQQWDAPNGWAPLQWLAIDGFRRHAQQALAADIARRWMKTVNAVYRSTGKLNEKYNVLRQVAGGGGEYPGQDGFGWTNGVMAQLMAIYPRALDSEVPETSTAAIRCPPAASSLPSAPRRGAAPALW